MGLDEQFGGDAESIKRWLAQRSTYASADVRMRVPPELREVAAPEPIDDDPAEVSTGSTTGGRSLEDVDSIDAGAEVLQTLHPEAAPRRQAASPVTVTEPGDSSIPLGEPGARLVRKRTPRQREQVSDATYAARSTNVVFAQRGTRRLLTGLVLVMFAAAVVAGGVAYVERTQPTVIAAVGLAFLALVVWGTRAAAAPTLVLLKHGQLEVRCGGRVEVADLANARTPIAVVGKTSSKRWRVLIERANEPLLVIDPSMVDPEAFTEVLYHVHPQLWSEPGAMLEPWQLR